MKTIHKTVLLLITIFIVTFMSILRDSTMKTDIESYANDNKTNSEQLSALYFNYLKPFFMNKSNTTLDGSVLDICEFSATFHDYNCGTSNCNNRVDAYALTDEKFISGISMDTALKGMPSNSKIRVLNSVYSLYKTTCIIQATIEYSSSDIVTMQLSSSEKVKLFLTNPLIISFGVYGLFEILSIDYDTLVMNIKPLPDLINVKLARGGVFDGNTAITYLATIYYMGLSSLSIPYSIPLRYYNNLNFIFDAFNLGTTSFINKQIYLENSNASSDTRRVESFTFQETEDNIFSCILSFNSPSMTQQTIRMNRSFSQTVKNIQNRMDTSTVFHIIFSASLDKITIAGLYRNMKTNRQYYTTSTTYIKDSNQTPFYVQFQNTSRLRDSTKEFKRHFKISPLFSIPNVAHIAYNLGYSLDTIKQA